MIKDNLIKKLVIVTIALIFITGTILFSLTKQFTVLLTFIIFLIIVFFIYVYIYRKLNKKKHDQDLNLINELQSRGLIIQKNNHLNIQILNELDRLNKEIEYKNNQITFMSTYSKQGLILINENKDIIYVNHTAEELIGLTNSKENSYIYRIRNQEIKNQIDKSFDKNELYSKDYLIQNNNLNIKTIPTSSKRNINVLVVVEDLSEKINLQTAKKDFFNFAGHELKTPITILKGYAELIYHNIIQGEETFEVAGKMIEQTNLMANFVEDMLMLSRLETYKDAPVIEVDLEERLKLMIETLDGYALTKNVIIRSYTEKLKIKADPVDIDKMYKNLIENAVKYNYENGTVDIRLESINDKVTLIIQNTGDGIDEIDLERIFERFYRVNQVRNVPGTGLGLSIVKHIVHKYNGTIEVESQKFKYTTFIITF